MSDKHDYETASTDGWRRKHKPMERDRTMKAVLGVCPGCGKPLPINHSINEQERREMKQTGACSDCLNIMFGNGS